eukprot:scaffold16869_cov84-Isochrysis_galbana.AAC.2
MGGGAQARTSPGSNDWRPRSAAKGPCAGCNVGSVGADQLRLRRYYYSRANATGHSTIPWQTSIASPFPPSLRPISYQAYTRLWGVAQGLVLYGGPGWRYGGGPRRGVGRCGLPLSYGGGGGAPVAWPLSPLTLRGGPLFKVLTVPPRDPLSWSQAGAAGGPSPSWKPLVAPRPWAGLARLRVVVWRVGGGRTELPAAR